MLGSSQSARMTSPRYNLHSSPLFTVVIATMLRLLSEVHSLILIITALWTGSNFQAIPSKIWVAESAALIC